jgi:DNA-binding FrmR family transcriptional regulator
MGPLHRGWLLATALIHKIIRREWFANRAFEILYQGRISRTLKSDRKMTHLEKNDREKQKLVSRIRRIRGQVDALERSLTTGDDCADILMLLANVRGGINSLMAEVLEDHIRLHIAGTDKDRPPISELTEDLINLVRAYLK